MKKILLVTIFLIPLVYACEKESTFDDFQSETHVRQIRFTEDDMQVFTYYNTGKIFEYLTRFTYRKYLYNNAGQLVKIEIAQSLNPLSCAIIPGTGFEEGADPRQAPIGHFVEFDYSGSGRIEKKRSYFNRDGNSQMTAYEVFEYEGDKVVRIEVYNPADQLMNFFTYDYDDRGNVIEELFYIRQNDDEDVLQSRKLSEFDDMNNPLRVLAAEGTPGPNTDMNNIVRQVYKNYYEDQTDSIIWENDYVYNNLDYPIRVNDLEYIYGEAN